MGVDVRDTLDLGSMCALACLRKLFVVVEPVLYLPFSAF